MDGAVQTLRARNLGNVVSYDELRREVIKKLIGHNAYSRFAEEV